MRKQKKSERTIITYRRKRVRDRSTDKRKGIEI